MKYHLRYKSPQKSWGPSVEYVRVDESGKMWIGNGEYESQVNFCPFTGTPAPVQMKVEDYVSPISGDQVKIYKNEE